MPCYTGSMHFWTVIKKLGRTLKNPAIGIEWFFAAAALTFGLVFLVIIPPMQGPDESNHFLRAYQITQGKILSEYVGKSSGGIPAQITTFDKSVGGNLPTGVVDFTQTAFGALPQQPDRRLPPHNLKTLAHFKTGTGTKGASFGNTAAYSPLAYLPHITGIAIGRMVSDRPIVAFYLARLFGLLAGVALITLAIRLMPFGKLPFAVIALLPMTVAQLAIVTADTMTISCAFLAIAMTLRFAFRHSDMSTRDSVLLVGTFAALSLVKPSLAVMVLIPLALLSNKHIAKKKVVILTVACVCAALLFGVGWNMLVKDMVAFGYQQAYPSDYSAQLSYIVHRPLTFVHVALGTIFSTHFDYSVLSFIGFLGWADTALPKVALAAGYINIALALFIASQSEKLSMPRWLRWLAAGEFFAVFFSVLTFMYLFCNLPKDTVVAGLQGRYFIPAVPLLIWLVLSGKKTLPDAQRDSYTLRSLCVSVIILFIMAWAVVARYYIAVT